MRSKVIVLGDFEDLYEETPMVQVIQCCLCGELMTEEIGTMEEYVLRCKNCGEDLT